ncbi:PREDICTED: tRNA-splicing endonuclease subunit Sen2-1 [Diuraphis noxia]|uniref:tRNA-splicing endonuclease subunit Sen2-1 n=1 Tax=Diuraphis noxia TaxID=143948 RepID=UPI0007635A59|nr:PREDICTED: tRNA-splicing endonuclease subunit Sen2-1 [Diuraphis noxia]
MCQINLANGCFGQFGIIDKDKFIDYKTLQNQVLRQKKNWQAMELVAFDFPHNTQNVTDEKNLHIKLQEAYFANKPVYNNWKELKSSCSTEYEQLLILSGVQHELSYFLLLEEAFFLCYTLECLEVRNENGSLISVNDCWNQFNSLKKNFPYFYAAFHYYRSKGWVVKPGQQYGGDYVLYKSSPIYYHSSYVVVISVNGQNSELLPSWPSWYGCGRAIEAASKELLICTVLGPAYEEGMQIDLSQYTVNDTIVRRWVPSQNRKKPNVVNTSKPYTNN